jgi:hypothetical protein
MLKALPSKISYSTLVVKLDDETKVSIPRRELWDVRVQLMAEEDDEGLGNLGKDDVRTGVYEGGFKSWESSIDVVKVLRGRSGQNLGPKRVLEVSTTSHHRIHVYQTNNNSLDAEQLFHRWHYSSRSWKVRALNKRIMRAA